MRAACFDRGVSSGSGLPFTVTFGDGCALTHHHKGGASVRACSGQGAARAAPTFVASARAETHEQRRRDRDGAHDARAFARPSCPSLPATARLAVAVGPRREHAPRARVAHGVELDADPGARPPAGVDPRAEGHAPRASATPREVRRARHPSRRLTRRRIGYRVTRPPGRSQWVASERRVTEKQRTESSREDQ